MPKAAVSTPAHLRPYTFHGFRMEGRDGSGNVIGTCPFCAREGKFSIKEDTGQWRCFVCAEGTEKGGGNIYTFLRLLWKLSEEATTEYEELTGDRRLLFPETLMDWGVAQSVTTGNWLVPGFNHEGKLNQLYKYIQDPATGKRILLPTPELGHHIHGANRYNPTKPFVYVCEGPWDGMALYEVMSRVKRGDDGTFASTGNAQVSLAATASILAVPGCGSVGSPFERWLPLFANKIVVLLFDNDHPKNNSSASGKGRVVEPAGYTATRRAVDLLCKAEERPQDILWLQWGEKGYDLSLPSGYDVRDHIGVGQTLDARVHALEELLTRVQPVPAEWIPGKTRASPSRLEMDCVPCSEWKVLINAWRQALKWTDGLDGALSSMMSVVCSTMAVGDQLWMKIIGPAGCGKTTLCEALSVNARYIKAKSTIRGFHSGYQVDREGAQDASLLAELNGKTLVTKDGDTLLNSPNINQILAEARDVYDGSSRTHYRNKQSRDYNALRITWVLCGTSSLRKLDSSELGERFLDWVIAEDMDEDLEDEIAMRVAYRASREMSLVADGKMETRDGPDLVRAKQLTGGYVKFLRENAQALLTAASMTDDVHHQCRRLAKFVARIRARPSTRQEEKAEHEMPFRLTSQLVRLAKCLTVVLNREEADKDVMKRVTKTAMDTARGRTLEIVRHLYQAGDTGLHMDKIAMYTNQLEEKEKLYVRFLGQIKVLELYKPQSAPGVSVRARWRLTQSMRKLYREVMGYAGTPLT